MADDTITVEGDIVTSSGIASGFAEFAEQINEIVQNQQKIFQKGFTANFNYAIDALNNRLSAFMADHEEKLETLAQNFSEDSEEYTEYKEELKEEFSGVISVFNNYVDEAQQYFSTIAYQQYSAIEMAQQYYADFLSDEANAALDEMQEQIESNITNLHANIDTMQQQITSNWETFLDGDFSDFTTNAINNMNDWSNNAQEILNNLATPDFSGLIDSCTTSTDDAIITKIAASLF